jgi:cobalamin synthase
VGGTTVINSGTCFRGPADVLGRWREEFGIPWTGDLEGEFEEVKRALAVKPLPAGRVGRNAELCRIGAEVLGASNGPLARNAGDVVCCATCPTGCALDAKRAMHVSELPRAVAAGCRIRARARVRSVIVEGGRAVGVKATLRGGRSLRVEAPVVVVAAGALLTRGLHLDGLADLADGLGSGRPAGDALSIMKRSDIGPFGVVGVVLALYLTGTALNVQSLLGVVFMIGIVVSNTVLLTDFAENVRKADRVTPTEAIRRAAAIRVRPVVMTALATFFALIPMALGLSRGSEANVPLGRAVLGGLVAGLLTTLFVVPCVYSLLVPNKFEKPRRPLPAG